MKFLHVPQLYRGNLREFCDNEKSRSGVQQDQNDDNMAFEKPILCIILFQNQNAEKKNLIDGVIETVQQKYI